MNKKFYLGAILLGAFTLMSGALTSCIDNDEPEGITVLRGAKAELLRAKAALELANAEVQKQTANLVAAQASSEQARAAKIQAEIAITDAQARLAKAQAEAQEIANAFNSSNNDLTLQQKKAEVEAEIAKQEKNLADQKNALEKAIVDHEKDMAASQEALANAQKKLEDTLAEIEAAKAILSAEQQNQLNKLQAAVYGGSYVVNGATVSVLPTDSAWGKLVAAQKALLIAEKALFETEFKQEAYVAKLELAVEDAKAELEAVNATWAEIQKLQEAATITDFEKEAKELEKHAGNFNATLKDYPSGVTPTGTAYAEICDLNIEKEKALKDTEAGCNYLDAQDATKKAKGTYTTDATKNKKYKISSVSDADAVTFSDAAWEKVLGQTGTKKSFKFTGDDKTKYNEIYANVDDTSKGYVATWDPKKVEKEWFGTDGKNGILTDADGNYKNITPQDSVQAACKLKADSAAWVNADTLHTQAVEKWQLMHQQMEDHKAAVTPKLDGLKDAQTNFNEKFKALDDAVTAYNTEVDAVYAAAQAAYIAAAKNLVMVGDYQAEAVDPTNTTAAGITDSAVLTAYTSAVNTATNIDDIKTVIGIYVTDSAKKTALLNACATASAWNPLTSENGELEKQAKVAARYGMSDTSHGYTNLYQFDYKGTPRALPSSLEIKDVPSVLAASPKSALKTKEEAMATAATNLGSASDDKQYKALVDAIGTENKTTPESATGYGKELNTNAHTYKLEGDELTAAFKALTNLDGKYAVAGNPVGGAADTQTGSAGEGTWYAIDVESDGAASNPKYVDALHYRVVRTAISDEALKKYAEPKFDDVLAVKAWEAASTAAFGVNDRHAELPVADCTGGTGAALKTAQDDLEADQEIIDAQANARENIAKIEAIIKKLNEEIAAADKVVADAVKAEEDAKKEYEKIVKPINEKIAAIKHGLVHEAAILSELNAAIGAYYGNNEFSYIGEDGEPVKFSEAKYDVSGVLMPYEQDFEGLTKWVKALVSQYTKKDPTFTAITGDDYKSHGKIKDAEYKLDKAEKTLAHAQAGNEVDGTHSATTISAGTAASYLEAVQAEIEYKKVDVEVAQKLYDFAVAQLNAYLEALSK